MKRKFVAIASAVLAGALAVTVTGCGSFGNTTVNYDDTTPYEIATQQGYDGSEASWLASVSGGAGSSEIRIAYEEAQKEGYKGSFLEFLEKYLAVTVDDSASVNKAMMSVVSVWCSFTELTTSMGGGYLRPSTTTNEVTSTGSGIIYSLDIEAGNALIVTNYHVIYDQSSVGTETVAHVSDDIKVFLYGGEISAQAIQATYLGGAMQYDLAVLKVENSAVLRNSSARAVVAANSDAITVGDKTYAIGNPEGEGISVTSGVVSVEAEYIDIYAADEKTKLSLLEIRTDAAVNHGNSGGGLFNADGKLIGIVNARTESTDVDGVGYAIPANLALNVVQNIIDNSQSGAKGAFRATLGVTTTVTDSKAVFSETNGKAYVQETVAISEVSSGISKDKLQAGDVLYSMSVKDSGSETVITRMHHVAVFLFTVRKGDTVEIKVLRGGSIVSVELTFDNNAYFTLFD